jgi:tRNA(Arg) A34 adenosine deaminase TadA
MALVIAAARRNIEEGTGGPFAAAIFERDTGVLVSLGVNLVVPAGLSMLHAEMLAFALAQQKLGSFDLGRAGLPAHELVTSSEPCAMCFGATFWAGVKHLLIGARNEDALAVGFDEGPKPDNWIEELNRRGISLERDLLRAEAAEVLRHYANIGGGIYNGRGTGRF